MKKQLFPFFIVFLLLSFQGFGQSKTSNRDFVSNHMFWFNGVLNGKIARNWNWQLDIEVRRQADPEHGYKTTDVVGDSKWNIFKNPYQDALRPWIHYQPNDKIRFSWSPITWFGSWSFPTNGKVTYQPEFRTSPQVTLYHQYGRVQFQQRYRLEFRFYGTKVTDTNKSNPFGPSSSYDFYDVGKQDRFRYMLRAIIPLNNQKLVKGTHYIMTSEEIFFKWGKNVANANIFDQSRFHLVYGYKFHPEIRFEIGYLNQTAFRLNNGYGQDPKTGNNVDFNNNLFVSVIFDNLNNLFKKKEAPTQQ
jgi:hypothetical protein